MKSCTVGFSPVLPSFETVWEHQDLPAESNEMYVLPFTVGRISVGVRCLSCMLEEAVAFPWPTDAIEAAPRPRWAGVPAILHRGADKY